MVNSWCHQNCGGRHVEFIADLKSVKIFKLWLRKVFLKGSRNIIQHYFFPSPPPPWMIWLILMILIILIMKLITSVWELGNIEPYKNNRYLWNIMYEGRGGGGELSLFLIKKNQAGFREYFWTLSYTYDKAEKKVRFIKLWQQIDR